MLLKTGERKHLGGYWGIFDKQKYKIGRKVGIGGIGRKQKEVLRKQHRYCYERSGAVKGLCFSASSTTA